jgi:hypothetical protein
MRVVVFGSREARDRQSVWVALDAIREAFRGQGDDITQVIDGKAPGIDSLAHQWALARGIAHLRFEAEWGRHGDAAGPIRNQQMIDEGQPHIAIMFPGGVGTADMKQRLEETGIEIVSVRKLRPGTHFKDRMTCGTCGDPLATADGCGVCGAGPNG